MSLKVSVYVYDNYGVSDCFIETIAVVEYEDSESEEKEAEENNKIIEKILNKKINTFPYRFKHIKFWLEIDTSTYLEYSTPPPQGYTV